MCMKYITSRLSVISLHVTVCTIVYRHNSYNVYMYMYSYSVVSGPGMIDANDRRAKKWNILISV